jgi:hypothetical protein
MLQAAGGGHATGTAKEKDNLGVAIGYYLEARGVLAKIYPTVPETFDGVL